jgi:all-trans-retinol dehydrogenase (NAD+)
VSEVADRVVLVTGGASGIGRLVAERLAALGARLVLWDVNQEALDRVVPAVEACGRHPAYGYVCDVGRREHVYEMAQRVRDEVGHVDVLINNAGIVSGQRFLDLPDSKIEATFRINTLALFWTCKAFLPEMIARSRSSNPSKAPGRRIPP